jgi:hypothetical protein
VRAHGTTRTSCFGSARLARHAWDLLYADDRVCERIAVPSHYIVLDRNVVELLLQAWVKTSLTVRIVMYAGLEEGGSASAGECNWYQLLWLDVGRSALKHQFVGVVVPEREGVLFGVSSPLLTFGIDLFRLL